MLEVFGAGTVTIVDGSQITYNEIAEVDDFQPFSASAACRLHILRDGLIYDYFGRHAVAAAERIFTARHRVN